MTPKNKENEGKDVAIQNGKVLDFQMLYSVVSV